ncbi:hypothetical protein ACFORL_10935 [Legionella dresdenensis]|uniref:Dot/Icm T4SS effector n=1 Tax=Legionella dresdenensis TaxID=450200 RepID=A0ABV8CGY0_9GAMM
MAVNIKLFDLDGCLLHPFARREYNNESHEQWLIKDNKEFLDRIINDARAKKYGKIVVAYGTNRQDFFVNRDNHYRGGSLSSVLPLIQSYLQQQLQEDNCEVVLDPFLMADIYGKSKKKKGIVRPIQERNHAAGDSYRAILRQEYVAGQEEEIEHAESIFNEDKGSIIYAHIERACVLNPEDDIVIDFYDDNPNVIKSVIAFAELGLFPKRVTFNIHKYNGTEFSLVKSCTGKDDFTDTRYDWTVRFLSSMGYHFRDAASEDQNIATAERLKEYHENDHYRNPGHKMAMEVMAFGCLFDTARFLKFREQEIPKLATEPALTSAMAYTTAQKLCDEGLLPGKFVFSDSKKAASSEKDANADTVPALPEHSAKADTLSAGLIKKIRDEVNSYQRSRGEVKNNTVSLSLISRIFRNKTLTSQKVKLADDLLNNIGNSDLTADKMRELIKSTRSNNRHVESSFNKVYGLFTKSGLDRSMNKIETMLQNESVKTVIK